MGLWDTFLSFFGGGTTESKPTKATRQFKRRSTSGTGPGSVLAGRVEYVGNHFAKLTSGGTRAVVFLREMADHYVSNSHDVLNEGQRVEFVIIERSRKKADEWVARLIGILGALFMRATLNAPPTPRSPDNDCAWSPVR